MTHAPITTIYLVHVPADGAPTIINRDLEGEIHEGLFRSWVRDAANAMLVELNGNPLPEIPPVEPIVRRVSLPDPETWKDESMTGTGSEDEILAARKCGFRRLRTEINRRKP